MNRKKENRLWLLMARKLSREIDEDEIYELQSLLLHNPRYLNFMEILSAFWKTGEAPCPPGKRLPGNTTMNTGNKDASEDESACQ